ncbi:MAG TPA: hypothetical protein VGL46_14880 [Pseudonocardiaceae bacterium]
MVIVWQDAEIMHDTHPDEHQIAVAVLEDVTATLSDPKATAGSPKAVSVYVTEPQPGETTTE